MLSFGLTMLVIAIAASSCTSTVEGRAEPGEVDISTLDVGAYPTGKQRLSPSLFEDDYKVLEGVRFADAIVTPYEVEPKYSHGLGGKLEMTPEDVDVQLPSFFQPVLRSHGMIMAFRTAGADSGLAAGQSFESGSFEGLSATIMRFPDEGAAKAASAEMDAVDFAHNRENVAVTLPDLPEASAHWRPDVPTLGASVPHGIFVISVFAGRRSVDLTALTKMVTDYLHAEISALDTFVPTPVDEFESIEQDPDGMQVR